MGLGSKTILLGEKDLDELNGKNSNGKIGWRKLVPFLGRGKKKTAASKQQELFVVPEKFNRKKPIYISEENIGQYKFKHCCHPIPGDDILGYIDNKHQIEIYRQQAPDRDSQACLSGSRQAEDQLRQSYPGCQVGHAQAAVLRRHHPSAGH